MSDAPVAIPQDLNSRLQERSRRLLPQALDEPSTESLRSSRQARIRRKPHLYRINSPWHPDWDVSQEDRFHRCNGDDRQAARLFPTGIFSRRQGIPCKSPCRHLTLVTYQASGIGARQPFYPITFNSRSGWFRAMRS
jgi:hypothetical protein